MSSHLIPAQAGGIARRRLLQAAALAAGGTAFAPLLARAETDWPQKPIRIVVPYAPGGSSDTLGRAIARYLSDAFHQPVVIENKAGAGGIIGSQLVAKAPPDGYTLVVSGIGSHVIAPANGGVFDPLKDFTHIAMLGGPPIALVVNAQQPWKDVASFVAAAQKPGDGISYATPGKGTHGHLTAELFRAALKLNLTHVSYKGAGPAVTDLLANQVPAGFMTLSSANAHVNSGKLRLLAVTAPKRLPEYPNTPTFEELGYPKLTGTTWFALSGPPGMPPAIVEKINAEVRRGMQTPAIQAQLKAESMVTADYTPAQFQHYIVTELERWGNPARAVLAGK
jgi:tripartite-type tricarboxylate transporter receptor subunit TctC